MRRSLTLSLRLLAPLAALAAPAPASIVSTSGMCTQIIPPASALPGALSAPNAWAWNEQTGIPLAAMPVELSTNPSNSNAPIAGALTGSFDSHFLHFDGVPGALVIGTITFSAPIMAVQYADGSLDLTDALATTGTLYPTTLPLRGFNNWTGADFVDINGNVLTFQFSSINPTSNLEQVRIFTDAVPAPGAAALLGLAGLLATARRRR